MSDLKRYVPLLTVLCNDYQMILCYTIRANFVCLFLIGEMHIELLTAQFHFFKKVPRIKSSAKNKSSGGP